MFCNFFLCVFIKQSALPEVLEAEKRILAGVPVAVERAAVVAGRDACGRRHSSSLQRDDEPTEAPR
jgi:hypothetical protein